MTPDHSDALTTALRAMAFGRIALGAASLAAPATLARTLGVRPTAELDYMTRVFGARATALGAAYLLGESDDRRRLQRLCLGVDVSDTVAGVSALLGTRPVSRAGIAAMIVLTGSYAAVGAARLAGDLGELKGN